MIWGAGAVVLWNICEKLKPLAGAGVAEIVPALTLNVTVITCGLPVALGEVTVIVPTYWPTVRLAPFTETVRFEGVVPAAGLTDNQFTPAVPLFATAE